jgi:hypothetical protein
MSIYACDVVSNRSVADYLEEQKKIMLAAKLDELAGMRFSIILTAKWQGSDEITAERRYELQTELSILRSLYLNELDEIAMTFGVEKAIAAKEEIERTVTVPDDMATAMILVEPDQLYF